MRENERNEFGKFLAATLDIYGSKMTTPALGIWWAALERFELGAVRAALSSHVQDTVTGKFAPKPADIIGQLQAMDGRPGPEESWAMMPRDEATTVVWTEEMAQAWGSALPLLSNGDQVGARMAFLERYKQLVAKARAQGESAKWTASLGTDQAGRAQVLLEAAQRGRLSVQHVAGLLPYHDVPAKVSVLKQIQQRAQAQTGRYAEPSSVRAYDERHG